MPVTSPPPSPLLSVAVTFISVVIYERERVCVHRVPSSGKKKPSLRGYTATRYFSCALVLVFATSCLPKASFAPSCISELIKRSRAVPPSDLAALLSRRTNYVVVSILSGCIKIALSFRRDFIVHQAAARSRIFADGASRSHGTQKKYRASINSTFSAQRLEFDSAQLTAGAVGFDIELIEPRNFGIDATVRLHLAEARKRLLAHNSGGPEDRLTSTISIKCIRFWSVRDAQTHCLSPCTF